MATDRKIPITAPRKSATFDDYTLSQIRRAAATGLYDIRGAGAKRALPHFDDLLFLGASISRYPLEGYREKCGANVVVGARFARTPLALDIPITSAGMSFGSLSGPAKEALGRGATLAGTSTTTGDGGMTQEERGHSRLLVYQVLPSRYGMNPDDLRRADAIEVVVGQGAKPGGGGMLLGQKLSKRVAEMRTLPEGIDQRSASRHPDWTGPDDLEIKIDELREITDWEKPIYVKVGASRPYYDTALAVKAAADVIVVDGMQGGTAATQEVFIEHVGIPTLAAIRPAEDFPRSMQRRQLLRSFNQATKELGDGPKRLDGGNRAGVHAGDSDSGLSRMAHPLCDGVQQQATACDGFSVPIRLGQTNKDVPPIIKQRDHARRQATAREILRDEAAPAPSILQFVENILSVSAVAIELAEAPHLLDERSR